MGDKFYCPVHRIEYSSMDCPRRDHSTDACGPWTRISSGVANAYMGEANPSTKDTNPKDTIGSTKLDMGLVPDSFIAETALAFTEGALKYGRYNWRVTGVRASIYHAALRRHMAKWWNGEDVDGITGVSHLASAAACLAVLIDGQLCGKLTDDRPPRSHNLAVSIDVGAQETISKLMNLHSDKSPHQCTIDDGEE